MHVHMFDSGRMRQVIFDHQQETWRVSLRELLMLGFGFKARIGVHLRNWLLSRATKIKTGLHHTEEIEWCSLFGSLEQAHTVFCETYTLSSSVNLGEARANI